MFVRLLHVHIKGQFKLQAEKLIHKYAPFVYIYKSCCSSTNFPIRFFAHIRDMAIERQFIINLDPQ